jgi:hypothetical protein
MLFKLLTMPLTAPLSGVQWIGEKIHEAALAQLNDPTEIKRKLAELEAKLDAGEIAEAEFEALEDELIQRLKTASQMMRKE